MAALTADQIAALLAEHEGCVLNGGFAEVGVTGVDSWSCGIRLPFKAELEDAERAHLGEAIARAQTPDTGALSTTERLAEHVVAYLIRGGWIDELENGATAEAMLDNLAADLEGRRTPLPPPMCPSPGCSWDDRGTSVSGEPCRGTRTDLCRVLRHVDDQKRDEGGGA